MGGVLRKLRMHLEERDGTLRKAALVTFTAGEASLYLFPYARSDRYLFGGRTMAAGQTDDTFDFRGELSAETKPKLSIHEGGQVHLYASDGDGLMDRSQKLLRLTFILALGGAVLLYEWIAGHREGFPWGAVIGVTLFFGALAMARRSKP